MNPITPAEAMDGKITKIHSDIIKVVNELLKQNFNGDRAVVRQASIVDAFKLLNPEFPVSRLTAEHHLDIESVYEKFGWKVEYHKPDYTESYEPYFKFSVKKRKHVTLPPR